MTDLSKYELIKSSGSAPLSVCIAAKNDGHDAVSHIRILRAVFGLTLEEAKRVSVEADTGRTLDSQQRSLIDDVVRVLDEDFGSDRKQPRDQ